MSARRFPRPAASGTGTAATAGPGRRRLRRGLGLGLLLTLVALLSLTADPARAQAAGRGVAGDGARVVAEQQVAPRQLDLTIQSPALGTTAKVRLLTPDGWSEHTRRHWPTLWLLHGCCGDYTSWTAMTDVASLAPLRQVLVVMPEAGDTGFYSDWLNEGAFGPPRWETFHLTEVRRILEASYGAGADRTVAGLSMGGFGALSYAGRHPGMFRAVASFSGVADPLNTPGGTDNVLEIARGQGADPYALWGDPVADRAVWAAHDPYDLARSLLRVPVFLSCGDGTAGPYDKPGVTSPYETLFLAENRHLASRLGALGDHRLVTDFYGPGTHTWPYWQRELHRALPMLLKAMGVPGH
ncbi:alpha/beta hydrolase family protein [Streptantibioticus parmotrematis]|uniref:alpha/beta hydrolase n=1 Tax=Streptantibioticus parmotrematis TaxID=2873249 RepID=UPI0033DE2070